MFIMKTLFKLARKFQLKYGQDNSSPEDPFLGLMKSIEKHKPTPEEEQQREEYGNKEQEFYIQEWYKEEAARKAEQERQQQEKQKQEAGKTPFTSQDAAAIVNQYLPEMKKKFPNLKGVTFNFMSSGEVSAGHSDPKIASYIRSQFGPTLSLALKKYLIDYKKIFKEQKVSFSI